MKEKETILFIFNDKLKIIIKYHIFKMSSPIFNPGICLLISSLKSFSNFKFLFALFQ